jgi:hypothetical protein
MGWRWWEILDVDVDVDADVDVTNECLMSSDHVFDLFLLMDMDMDICLQMLMSTVCIQRHLRGGDPLILV